MEATTPEMLSRINKRNEEFWSEQNKLLEERMEYAEAACRLLEDESRQLPFCMQRGFYALLESAERMSIPFQRILARKAAKAPKGDPLSQLIAKIVQNQPGITAPQLLECLKSRGMVDPIQEINDEEIILFKRGKSIPISGLKDRLSRVKRSMRSKNIQ